MMLGYPGETIDDMSRSFKFIKRTRPERVCVSQVTPFPGTKLWMDNADDIILRDWDDVARHVRKPKFKSMEKMQAVIELYIVLMSKEFDDRMIGKYIYFDKMIAGFFLLYPNLSAFILKKARQLKEFLLSVPLGRILLRKDVNR
jgi:radical SAM superfamily enzyme YgiQ (UPF0313 family)